MGFSINVPRLNSNIDWRLQAALQKKKDELIGSSITNLLSGTNKVAKGLGRESDQSVDLIKRNNMDMAKRAIVSADRNNIDQIAKELDNTQLLDRAQITDLLIKKADQLKQEDYKNQMNQANRVKDQFNLDKSAAALNNNVFSNIYNANMRQKTLPLDYQLKQIQIAKETQGLLNPNQKQNTKQINSLVKAYTAGYKDPQVKGLLTAILTQAGNSFGEEGVVQIANQTKDLDRDELQQYLIKMNR
jgi:hypothetical protein